MKKSSKKIKGCKKVGYAVLVQPAVLKAVCKMVKTVARGLKGRTITISVK